MSYMLSEIREQPSVLRKLVDAEIQNARSIAAEVARRDIEFVEIAARGTSDHNAIYGKYLLEINNGLPVALADPSVITLYSGRVKLGKALVIGVSQSGEATDVAECLAEARKSGGLTVSITNNPGSTHARMADHTILCHAGEEKAVAATKSYVASLAVFYILSAVLAGDEGKIEALVACADVMDEVLKIEDEIAVRAERYRYMESGTVLARGLNYCTALETALKLAETSYLKMKGYSAADFVHGPIAAVHSGDPCFLIGAPGKTYGSMLDIARKLEERGAETVILSSEQEMLSLATVPVRLDAVVQEELSPLLYVVPGQLFAYHLSTIRGCDPDHPRGLTKVTLTR